MDDDVEQGTNVNGMVPSATPTNQATALAFDEEEQSPRASKKRSGSLDGSQGSGADAFAAASQPKRIAARNHSVGVLIAPSSKPLSRRSRTIGSGLAAAPGEAPRFITQEEALNSDAADMADIGGMMGRPLARQLSKAFLDIEADGETTPNGDTPEGASSAVAAAMAIWLGLTMDGVPEAMVIGILANGEAMSMALVVGVFLANFPEAIATAAMMKKHGMPLWKNMLLWWSLCIMTGLVAMLAAMIFPRKSAHWVDFFTTGSEGLAAGAMLAMISGAMLPEAYHLGNADLVGFWTVFGFVSVLAVKVMYPAMPEVPGEEGHHPAGHASAPAAPPGPEDHPHRL